MRVHECVTSGPWPVYIAQVLSVFLCSFLCARVCGYGVDFEPMVSFVGLLYIYLLHFHFCFFSVYSYLGRHGRVARHAPQVLPYIYVDRVSWGQRLQVKGHGGVSSTFNTLRPSQGSIRPQVSPLVGKYSAYIRIYTAG